MSGHSKWSTIKRQKGLNDVKKGQVYTKIAKQIVIAARQGGGDQTINFALKMAINKGRAANMPGDNIEKAIKKGLGEDKNSSVIESVTYEAYGFGGATILIDVLTDNRHRSAADIHMIIEKNGGRSVEAGAISWQYDTMGLISLVTETQDEKKLRNNRKWNVSETQERKLPTDMSVIEEFELALIDTRGVIDVSIEKDSSIYVISIYTALDKLDFVRKAIEAIGYDVTQSEIIKKAQMEILLQDETLLGKNMQLIDKLEENEDVDVIWTNITNL